MAKKRQGDATPQLDLFAESHPPASPNEKSPAPWLAMESPSGLRSGGAFPNGLLVGTCAFMHEHWRGVFYPKGMPSTHELAYYAGHCNAVEIDGSFYRVPARSTVERWLDVTPQGFRFALKAPKALTHEGRLSLKEPAARAAWEELLALVPMMGERLSAILLQLGPWVTANSKARLREVIESAGRDVPLAVEFRSKTWDTPDVSDMLRGYGAVRVWSDGYLDSRRGLSIDGPEMFARTGPFIYIRLLGNVATKYNTVEGGLNHQYGTVLFDRADDFSMWKKRITGEIARGFPVQCFINNHYEGFSPLTVARLKGTVPDRAD